MVYTAKPFVWPVPVTNATPNTTPTTDRRVLLPARPAATPNPPPPAPHEPAAVIPLRVPHAEKPPRPAYNPRYTAIKTEQMVARTEAAWRSEKLQAEMDGWLMQMSGGKPYRRADGLSYDDVLALVRMEYPELRGSKIDIIAAEKYCNPEITDAEIRTLLANIFG